MPTVGVWYSTASTNHLAELVQYFERWHHWTSSRLKLRKFVKGTFQAMAYVALLFFYLRLSTCSTLHHVHIVSFRVDFRFQHRRVDVVALCDLATTSKNPYHSYDHSLQCTLAFGTNTSRLSGYLRTFTLSYRRAMQPRILKVTRRARSNSRG